MTAYSVFWKTIRETYNFNIPDLRLEPIPEATCEDAQHIARMYGYPNGLFENEPEAPADVEMKSEPEQPSESEQDRIWRITQEIAQG